MQVYIPREIDINDSIEEFSVKQRDHLSRLFCIKIYDDRLSQSGIRKPMDLSGCTARLYTEGNNNVFYLDGEVIDQKNGVIKFLLSNGITNSVGRYKCEIWITNSEEASVISTKPFYIKIDESIRHDESLIATDQFSALDNALLTVDSYDGRINSLDKKIDRLIAMPEITTGVEREVADIRYGYDGETHYDSAGQAVRYQIQEIHARLSNMVATSEEFWSVINETN